MMLQAGGAVASSPLELLLIAGPETKAVLGILLCFSLIAWFIIVLKWWQFRRLHRQGARFFADLERTNRLQDAYQSVMKQPQSPYTRLFREAINFYSELRPGAEVAAERDLISHYVPWLATIGSVSPLLGLLGTTLGVMNAFLGISSKGSGNIGAVAPGVAEALTATAAGLVAAIPAVIAYNLYVNRLRLITGELEGFASEVIGSMAREGLV